MSCDICGKNGQDLNTLLESFQTKEIKDVCHNCLRKVEDYKSRALSRAIDAMVVDVKGFMEDARRAKRC